MNSYKPSFNKMPKGFKTMSPDNFKKTVNNKEVKLFTIKNESGARADITNYGGRIVTLIVPDYRGIFDDVVTGFSSIDEYLNSNEVYFGALIGRFGNRIANGKFSIDGKEYSLKQNNGPNSLHGGPNGFHNVVWEGVQVDDRTLELLYFSPHMEEGFPGNLKVNVRYTLTDKNELRIDYNAETDRKTVVNLTSHPFFNLSGEGSKTILDHVLKINAEKYTPVDEHQIPTGKIEEVAGTPFDFRDYMAIGKMIESDNIQIAYGSGYDHNFVLETTNNRGFAEPAASVYDPNTGRQMDVLTTEPGLQFYSGNFLTGKDKGKRGEPYLKRTSFCLETQHFPDSPNKPGFPSTLLLPGEKFKSTTIYRFSTLKPENNNLEPST